MKDPSVDLSGGCCGYKDSTSLRGHKSGRRHSDVDALSRSALLYSEDTLLLLEDVLALSLLVEESFVSEQPKDPTRSVNIRHLIDSLFS